MDKPCMFNFRLDLKGIGATSVRQISFDGKDMSGSWNRHNWDDPESGLLAAAKGTGKFPNDLEITWDWDEGIVRFISPSGQRICDDDDEMVEFEIDADIS